MSKKGQSVMMFVSVVNPENKHLKSDKTYTSKMMAIWQSNLNNNHIEVQVSFLKLFIIIYLRFMLLMMIVYYLCLKMVHTLGKLETF